jgi:predicted nucleic acid-binding protein
LRLFDTGFIVDLVNADEGALKVAKVVDDEASLAAISAISVHEYLFGVYFKYIREPDELKTKLISARNDLERFEVIPVTREVAEVSGRFQAELAASGSQIRINDVYIAATAARYGLSLVTRNIKLFKRIPKLKVENY